MKIGLYQIYTKPEKILENKIKIIDCIKKSEKQALDLAVFPELSLTGYYCLDKFLDKNFINLNLKAIIEISKFTKKTSVLVGFVSREGNNLYNSVAFLSKGKHQKTIHKRILPNYDIFFEKRYFLEDREIQPIIEIDDIKLGVMICEDLWDTDYDCKPCEDLNTNGADIFINISCSPFCLNKQAKRIKIIKEKIKKYKKPIIYLNSVGIFDGYDGQIGIDGRSLVFDYNNKKICELKSFSNDFVKLKLEKNSYGKLNINTYQNKVSNKNYLQSDNQDELDLVLKLLKLGIKDYFLNTKLKKVIVAISGGIDSSLVATLATLALGPENVIGLFLPSKFTSKQSKSDVLELTKNLGISLSQFSIEEINHSFNSKIRPKNKISKQNIQSRIRGLILMTLANDLNALVLGTSNRTETAIGYCTLYGDTVGGLFPIADLDKNQVYALAKYINLKADKIIIPSSIFEKRPTAELANNQTDEDSIGINYQNLVPITNMLIDGFSLVEIQKLFDPKIVKRVNVMIRQSEFKRRQLGPAIKINDKSFGIGRRLSL